MTRNTLLAAAAAVCLGSGVLFAQTPSEQVTGSPSRGTDKSTVTVQGCLQTTNDTRTSSGTSKRGQEEFIVTNARINTGGSSGSAVYRITGLSDADLRPHLNQRVELTGRIDDQHQGSADRTASSASSSMDSNNAPKLRASAVRMLSASCTGSGTH